MNHPVAFLSRLLLTMMCFSLASPLRSADKDKELKRAAEDLAQNIANLKLQRLYVPDFLCPDAARSDRGAYLAAVFAKFLAERAGKKFDVVDRSVVQRSYDSLNLTAHDLQERQVLTRLGVENGADGILLGCISQTAKEITIDLFAVGKLARGKSCIPCNINSPERHNLKLYSQRSRIFPGVSSTFPVLTVLGFRSPSTTRHPATRMRPDGARSTGRFCFLP